MAIKNCRALGLFGVGLMAIFCGSSALAARPDIPLRSSPSVSEQSRGKLSPELETLVQRMSQYEDAYPGDKSQVSYAAFSTSALQVSAGGDIEVVLRLSAVSAENLNALTQKGFSAGLSLARYGLIQGRVHFRRLLPLADLEFVRSIAVPDRPRTRTGSVTSEGDAVILADQVRANFGYTGAGVRVGVISDGVAGIFDSVASGDIPSGSDVSCDPSGVAVSGVHCQDFAGAIDGGSEGTAMLEIVHDVAPGASLYFTNASSEAGMISAIEWLSKPESEGGAAVDIIVDDLGFYQQPYFEDGEIAQAAEAAVVAGAVFVSAAGNDGLWHVQEVFSDSDGDGFHNFSGTGLNSYRVSIPAEWFVSVSMQWSDSFASATHDLNLYADLYSDPEATQYLMTLRASNLNNIGSTPEEGFSILNPDTQEIYAFIFVEAKGSVDASLQFELFPSFIGEAEYVDPADSIFGHPAAEHVISTGAIAQDDADHNDIETFSSQGPSTVLGTLRNEPDVASIDNVSVTANGGFYTPFPGTSAAAPHAAACLALILEAKPELTPDEARSALLNGAVDLGTAGFDTVFGAGRTDCENSVSLMGSTSGGGSTPTEGGDGAEDGDGEEDNTGDTGAGTGGEDGGADDDNSSDGDDAGDDNSVDGDDAGDGSASGDGSEDEDTGSDSSGGGGGCSLTGQVL